MNTKKQTEVEKKKKTNEYKKVDGGGERQEQKKLIQKFKGLKKEKRKE